MLVSHRRHLGAFLANEALFISVSYLFETLFHYLTQKVDFEVNVRLRVHLAQLHLMDKLIELGLDGHLTALPSINHTAPLERLKLLTNVLSHCSSQ